MTARLTTAAAAAVIAACVVPEGAAQPPTRPPNLVRRADPPTAPLTGILRAPEWRHGGPARPGTLPAIPDYAYTPDRPDRNVPPAVTVLSLVRVPVARIAGADPLPKGAHPAQMYQLPVPWMQAGHCYLSRVAVMLHDDGTYQLSFRADQNPRPGPDSPAPPTEFAEGPRLTQQTGQLKRNLFLVRVRGYAGGGTVSGDRPGPNLGRPAVWELPVEPFWVQNGEPYPGFVSGRAEMVRRYFEYIDRVEVEFTYR